MTNIYGFDSKVKLPEGYFGIRRQPKVDFTNSNKASQGAGQAAKKSAVSNSPIYPTANGADYARMHLEQGATPQGLLRNLENQINSQVAPQAAPQAEKVKLPEGYPGIRRQPKVDFTNPNKAAQAVKPTSKPNKAGFFSEVGNCVKNNKGKIALIGAVALGIGALAAWGMSKLAGKKDEQTVPVEETPTTPTVPPSDEVPETPEVPTEPTAPIGPEQPAPVYVPQLPVDLDGTYTTKKGDSFWKIAEKHLIDKNKDVEGYRPTNREIQQECDRIMKENNRTYDENHFFPVKMLYPGEKIKIQEPSLTLAA